MRATVKKTFRFEAAHHLPNHDGKCREPHGHSYRVVAEVAGSIEAREDHAKLGMVIDFGDLKAIWKANIEPRVDHQDLNLSLEPMVTTAEMIAVWMIRKFREGGVPVSAVEVWETETSCARVVYEEVWVNGS